MASIISRYTTEELENIVNDSVSFKDVLIKLGYGTTSGSNHKTLKKYLKEYNISTDHFKYVKGIERTDENVFCENSTVSQAVLRRWFVRKMYVPYRCNICGLEGEWQGKSLTLQLDHIDGNNSNNALYNLRWLCPNCHSQTQTYAGKNLKSLNKKSNKADKIRKQNKSRIARRKVVRPPPDQLESELFETNFAQVGRKYGVTDNTIRKWCKSYGMSTRSKDYKKIKLHKEPNYEVQLPKGVIMMSKDGECIKVFESRSEAARFLVRNNEAGGSDIYGISAHIGAVCSEKRKSAYGYVWRDT